jgi:hypothetical protein
MFNTKKRRAEIMADSTVSTETSLIPDNDISNGIAHHLFGHNDDFVPLTGSSDNSLNITGAV